MTTYAFIGLGNMAAAIIRGMRRSGKFEQNHIVGFDVDTQKIKTLQAEAGVEAAPSAREAVKLADVVVLAVKPQTLPQLLPGIAALFNQDKLAISIAGGIPLGYLAQYLGNVPTVRIMPSLNARVGLASSAICASVQVTPAQLAQATELFEAIGSVTPLPEGQFGAFTALAGAAPAFAFQFIDALASAGVKAGLARPLAQRIAAEMTCASATLVQQSNEHPVALIDQVCSPGGTTIEGMHALKALGFEHALHQAVAAVIEKDQRMAK